MWKCASFSPQADRIFPKWYLITVGSMNLSVFPVSRKLSSAVFSVTSNARLRSSSVKGISRIDELLLGEAMIIFVLVSEFGV